MYYKLEVWNGNIMYTDRCFTHKEAKRLEAMYTKLGRSVTIVEVYI